MILGSFLAAQAVDIAVDMHAHPQLNLRQAVAWQLAQNRAVWATALDAIPMQALAVSLAAHLRTQGIQIL